MRFAENEWHQSLASMASSEVAILRLRDRYHRVLTIIACWEGMNVEVIFGLGAGRCAEVLLVTARRTSEIARRAAAETSLGSCCSFLKHRNPSYLDRE